MNTITTRVRSIPIIATRITDPNATSPGWEVKIAPNVPWTFVPYELRSTYVSATPTSGLLAATSTLIDYVLLMEDDPAVTLVSPIDRLEWDVFLSMQAALNDVARLNLRPTCA